MIKTLTLDGLTSVTVKESPFDMARFCWVRNRTEADVYISCTDPQCTPNADGVKCISAGECGMLDSESRETLYISGSGVVNIETTPFLVCPFNRGGKGGVSYELPIATTEILGGVMPDGTTITVDENGVISGSKASAGSSTRPVYFSNGKPVACSYTLGKSVPSNAVFTDTVYTLPIATTSALGGVIPDGTSITVDENGVISAVGGSDDWTNVGNVSISTSTATEFSIPNLSNYKLMMLSICIQTGNNKFAYNYTRIFALDDYKPSSDWSGPYYYIGNDILSTNSTDTVYPYIGNVTIDKSTNKVIFRGRTGVSSSGIYANIYMK